MAVQVTGAEGGSLHGACPVWASGPRPRCVRKTRLRWVTGRGAWLVASWVLRPGGPSAVVSHEPDQVAPGPATVT